MGEGAEHTLPTRSLFILIKVQMRRSHMALLGGSDPRWSLWGAMSRLGGGGGLAPQFERFERGIPLDIELT